MSGVCVLTFCSALTDMARFFDSSASELWRLFSCVCSTSMRLSSSAFFLLRDRFNSSSKPSNRVLSVSSLNLIF